MPKPLAKANSSPTMRPPLPKIRLNRAVDDNFHYEVASSRTTSPIWSTSSVSVVSSSIPPENQLPSVQTEQASATKEKSVDVVEPEQPVDMSWPSTFYKRCVYLALAPIMFPLYYTLPDVKKPVSL
jgi:hypothetical protein